MEEGELFKYYCGGDMAWRFQRERFGCYVGGKDWRFGVFWLGGDLKEGVGLWG